MGRHQLLQRLLQQRRVQRARELDVTADVVQRRITVTNLVQPDVALGGGEGQGVDGRHGTRSFLAGLAADSSTADAPLYVP